MFSENYRQEIYKYFQKLVIPGGKEKIYSLIEEQEEDVRIGLEFLYASMPESDIADYEPELFLDYARHGVKLWEEQRWGVEIPEKIFANYVLHHRVNNEDLVVCRPFFYEQLAPMICGKSMKEAVTLINYWCSAVAAYRATDGRTANAMTVFRSAYGRCGEESTFAVTVLRSVGIPARQVYAPLWSHCDDNHAWVEVWIDGDWYFFGACEPDEIMNVGWFTNPSSRAMMVLSRWLGCDQPEEQIVGKKGAARIVNHLSRYAKTTNITVAVKDDSGNPVPGARIRCCVVNYGMFGEIATLEAGEDGTAKMKTGLGSLFLSCQHDECYGEILINTKSETHTEIILKKQPFRFDQWEDLDMEAPEERPINVGQPTEEQRVLRQERTEKCAAHRKKRIEGFFSEEAARKAVRYCPEPEAAKKIMTEAAGNMGEICTFLQWREEEADLWKWKMALLGQLTDKDYRDCKASVLRSHLEAVLPLKKELPDNVFTECMLNPRIDIETMTAYAAFIQNYFKEEKKAELSSDVGKIITYIEEHIVSCPQKEYGALLTTPVGCLRSGAGSVRSKEILLVALCRSLGIAARLNPVNKVPEIWQGDRFVPAKVDKTTNSAILIKEDGKTVWNYNQNWSVSSFQDGVFVPLSPTEENIKARRIPAVPGIYRLVTCNRLAGGSQLVRKMDFMLKDGEEKETELSLPEADASRMLKNIQLPEFELYREDGQKVKASEMDMPVTGNLMFWLEESREPTEHILNEIYEQAESFEPYQRQMYFVLRSEEAKRDLNISRVLGKLSGVQIMYDTAGENVQILGTKAGVDPDKMPLILIMREELQCVFAASGYNVGTADMLLRILKMTDQ